MIVPFGPRCNVSSSFRDRCARRSVQVMQRMMAWGLFRVETGANSHRSWQTPCGFRSARNARHQDRRRETTLSARRVDKEEIGCLRRALRAPSPATQQHPRNGAATASHHCSPSHARGHRGPRRSHGPHFENRAFGVRQEVQNEQGGNAAVPSGTMRQAVNSSDHEGLTGITTVSSSVFDEGGHRIAAYDRRRVGMATDRIGKRARATPGIQPVNAARDSQPRDELRCETSAPSAHEILVA